MRYYSVGPFRRRLSMPRPKPTDVSTAEKGPSVAEALKKGADQADHLWEDNWDDDDVDDDFTKQLRCVKEDAQVPISPE